MSFNTIESPSAIATSLNISVEHGKIQVTLNGCRSFALTRIFQVLYLTYESILNRDILMKCIVQAARLLFGSTGNTGKATQL